MQQATLIISLVAYLFLLPSFSNYMAQRPFAEKVGYVPQPFVMKTITADQKTAAAAMLVLKVLFYYGDLIQRNSQGTPASPDYHSIYANLTTATRLDPYNMDAYYFAQALAWDKLNVQSTIELLEFGMQHRTWDYFLPFYAGFDAAYFLKDYDRAARYFKKAADLSGADLFVRLTSRYLHQAGKTNLAIAYLQEMQRQTTNKTVRQALDRRLTALQRVRRIELARDRYLQEKHRLPPSISALVEEGYLDALPADPYGGSFFISKDGSIDSTSHFALGKTTTATSTSRPSK